jgi:ribosomal protein L11 methyltransferase
MAEIFGDELLEQGAVSVTYLDAGDNPIFEPEINRMPLWQQTYVIALFMEEQNVPELLSSLQSTLGLNSFPEYKIETVPEKDWERVWMDEFKPIRFGERLWICPSWCDVPDPTAVNLLLDPGLAFGTGTHPTTALCLEWLATHDVLNKTVIDYGCGSGILGIAAAKLGARKIWAVDIHPQALEATLANATQNDVCDTLEILYPSDLPEHIHCELLVANILAEPLRQLASHFAERVIPGGKLILSGILREQAPTIIDCYRPWFNMAEPVYAEDWCLLSGSRLL